MNISEDKLVNAVDFLVVDYSNIFRFSRIGWNCTMEWRSELKLAVVIIRVFQISLRAIFQGYFKMIEIKQIMKGNGCKKYSMKIIIVGLSLNENKTIACGSKNRCVPLLFSGIALSKNLIPRVSATPLNPSSLALSPPTLALCQWCIFGGTVPRLRYSCPLTFMGIAMS